MPTRPRVSRALDPSLSSEVTSFAPTATSTAMIATTRGVAHREPEPDRDRSLAVGDELAGGVVDRGDVVGVEGVPQPVHVGRDPEAEAEDLGADVELGGHDEGEQQPERDDVQAEDDREQAQGPGPGRATCSRRRAGGIEGCGGRTARVARFVRRPGREAAADGRRAGRSSDSGSRGRGAFPGRPSRGVPVASPRPSPSPLRASPGISPGSLAPLAWCTTSSSPNLTGAHRPVPEADPGRGRGPRAGIARPDHLAGHASRRKEPVHVSGWGRTSCA